MEYEKKSQLVKEGEDILRAIESRPAGLVILRQYNKWYTSSLEFVQFHTKSRLDEFMEYHKNNQGLLREISPDYQLFCANLTVQLAIIEGSQDHSYKVFVA